jgi:hypothetical protein
MDIASIRVGTVVTGPLWPEPLEVLATVDLGSSVKLVCKGLRTGLVRDPVLTQAQLAQLQLSPARVSIRYSPAPHVRDQRECASMAAGSLRAAAQARRV